VEIGFTFVTVAILTGSMWAKLAWNTWWAWDPRLVTLIILWLIYLAHFMLRRRIDDPEQCARFAAVYTIPAFASVPFTFLAIFWWRGMPSVMSGLGPRMLVPLQFSVGAFTLLQFALLRHRMRLAWLGRQITSLREQLEEREA
jgi:heme exporter protein C